MKYNKEDGEAVVLFLLEEGFKDVQLIGSLKKNGESDHDIDIYVPNCSENDKEKLIELFLTCGMVEETDWHGMYFSDTIFGDIDIFFCIDDLDY